MVIAGMEEQASYDHSTFLWIIGLNQTLKLFQFSPLNMLRYWPWSLAATLSSMMKQRLISILR